MVGPWPCANGRSVSPRGRGGPSQCSALLRKRNRPPGDYAWAMLALGAISGPLPKLGVVAVALCGAGAILLARGRARAATMLAAVILTPLLLLAEVWRSPQLRIVHSHPLEAVVAAVAGLALVAVLAVQIRRWPWLLAPLAVAALPFRVPIQSGSTSANLLVPLYLVVGAAALAAIWGDLLDGAPAGGQGRGPAGNGVALSAGGRFSLDWALAGYLVVYAAQASYSVDFEQALQNVVFFYVPFALMYALLRDLRFDRRLLARCLSLAAGLAVVFCLIAYVEYATRTLLLNSKLQATDQLHTYFVVNSVFFDPNIFGRFLALVMVLAATVLLYSASRRLALTTALVLAILWSGLLLTLSRSSIGALLVGLAVLAALRWKLWPVLALGAAVIVVGLVALAITPRTFGLNQGLNGASSGRASLITGGVRMFAQRPLLGYGSGAFVTEYRRQHPGRAAGVSASHTIPVTIAAEQGSVGLLFYGLLLAAACVTLLRGARGDPARVALAAAFLALVFHTMLYADFLEDPTTWALLAIGAALSTAARAPEVSMAVDPTRPAALTAGAAP
jgi:putative inorganic carbon (HCO3(-)) transporter